MYHNQQPLLNDERILSKMTKSRQDELIEEDQDQDEDEYKNERIKVICRFRPLIDWEINLNGQVNGLQYISKDSILVNTKIEPIEFKFNRIFDCFSGQKKIFNYISNPILKRLFKGYNCTVMCYGQTSSGKTHTMQGPGHDMSKKKKKKNYGLIPRIIESIYELIESDEKKYKHIKYQIKMSFYEIYMEKINDLLDFNDKIYGGLQRNCLKVKKSYERTMKRRTISVLNKNMYYDKIKRETKRMRNKLIVKEAVGKNMFFVSGLNEVIIKNKNECLEYYKNGNMNKKVDSSFINNDSSRSHTVFQLIIEQNNSKKEEILYSKLNMVDLAGSERSRKTGCSGKRLKEANNINQSLSVLGKVIYSLNSGSKHIPYRESVLTKLLKDSIGGKTFSILILNCSPCNLNFCETVSTLRFGSVCKRIKNKIQRNIKFDDVSCMKRVIKRQKEKIKSLKKKIEIGKNFSSVSSNIASNTYKAIDSVNTNYFHLIEKINQKDELILELEDEIYSLKKQLYFLKISEIDHLNDTLKSKTLSIKIKRINQRKKMAEMDKSPITTAISHDIFSNLNKKKKKMKIKKKLKKRSRNKKDVNNKKNVNNKKDTNNKKDANKENVHSDITEEYSTDSESDDDITDKCGFVQILESGKVWKKRWIMRHNDLIKCYEGITSLEVFFEFPLKEVKVKKIDKVIGKEETIFGIEIIDSSSNLYILKLPNEIERTNWLRCFDCK